MAVEEIARLAVTVPEMGREPVTCSSDRPATLVKWTATAPSSAPPITTTAPL
jgi:hypothetical protein